MIKPRSGIAAYTRQILALKNLSASQTYRTPCHGYQHGTKDRGVRCIEQQVHAPSGASMRDA